LSAAAVNVEVVRSRAGGSGEIKSFAERAVLGIGQASTLSNALLALTSAALSAAAAGRLTISRSAGPDARISLEVGAAAAEGLVSEIERLMTGISVGVEQLGDSVILSVSTRGNSHSKV
jgi:hypothetical protein